MGFGLKLGVASSKIGLKFSFYFQLNSCYSCWKLYWQAYTYNLYFLSSCLAELETFGNKSLCSAGEGNIAWCAQAQRKTRIPFISMTFDQVIDHKLFTTVILVAITEEVFMDRHEALFKVVCKVLFTEQTSPNILFVSETLHKASNKAGQTLYWEARDGQVILWLCFWASLTFSAAPFSHFRSGKRKTSTYGLLDAFRKYTR